MSIEMHPVASDRMVVTYDPEIDKGEDLTLLAAIAHFLEQNFGIPLDCDWLEIHLCWLPDGEEAPQGPRKPSGVCKD